MGIRGLTRYIEERAHLYLEPFELHDTKLIIDGWNLRYKLYLAAECDDRFGGSYDRYAEYVFQFFNDLFQCKVHPLVILDGGWEMKKKSTLIERIRERIKVAGGYGTMDGNFGSQLKKEMDTLNNNFGRRQAAFPLFCAEVFIGVLRKLGIKYAVTTFEADDSMASIGKLLDVPVLSYDSDFFIFGVDYIPFNTLETYPVRYAKGYVKKCRIYRTSALLQNFKGLTATVLPLVPVLLGNDYIETGTFNEFFNHLYGQCHFPIPYGRQQQIERIFNWLKSCTLKDAVVAVLDRLPINVREDILESIQMIFNGYSSISTRMIEPLGIDKKIVLDKWDKVQSFKLIGDYDNLDTVIVESDETQESRENDFAELVPKWFIEDHSVGKLPSYFVNIVTHQTYMMAVQVEDYTEKSVNEDSLPIVQMICSILTTTKRAKTNDSNKIVHLLLRKGDDLGCIDLPVPLSSIAFEDIRISPLVQRRRIIHDTLNIRANDKLCELPFTWQLYFAVILFWMRSNNEIEHTMLHLTALLMTSLSGILERTIGFNKLDKTSRRKFFDEFTKKQEKKGFEKVVGDNKSVVILNLINSVSQEDCNAVLPFFVDHAGMDGKPSTNFSISIVHVYAQFQSLLKHAMDLNALLGYVYAPPSLDEFLDGTLFHNLYQDFSTQLDVHAYIAKKFEHSPGLLKLFQALKQNILDALEIEVSDCNERNEIETERIRCELGRMRV